MTDSAPNSADDPRPRSGPAPAPSARPVFIALAVLIAAVGTAMTMLVRGRERQGVVSERANDAAEQAKARRTFISTMSIPAFTLRDQDGRDAGTDIFRGGRTVLVFTFTRCPAACPSMLSNLLPLYFDPAASDLRFVSITVDPERDTPEVLKAHAASLGVDGPRWRMLTGDEAEIRNIVASLKFALAPDPANPIDLGEGRSMPNIIHPTWAVLIGPDGRVIDFFEALTREGVEALKRAAVERAAP